ncbi:MAG TPA: CheR family methyltransferase, partial [Actinomycetota bacterium]|nr:CheR family methyltransferase [Actinomycetota bacterium]
MTDISVAESATFEALLDYLKRTRGFDFTAYKRPTLYRRILKRVQDMKLKSFTDYLDYLEVHPEEFPQLFDTILINVTSFFRDPQAWTYVTDIVLPEILAGKDATDPIRVWSAACASGEEVYTLAMVLAEKLGMKAFKERVKIYATDVDEHALSQARAASYTPKDVQAVPEELRKKFFERVGQRYVFSPDLRRSVIFGRHDLLEDAPISRLDLLVCRNALMYFNVESQSRILARFHFALNENGYLFLGKVEMLLTQGNMFLPTNLKARVFAKVPRRGLRDRLMLMAQAGANEEYESLLSSQTRLRDSAFESALLPSIVVDSEGTVAQANDQARGLFHLTARDIGRPLQDLELSYRPIELRSHIDQAYRQREAETIPAVEWFRGPDTVYLEVRIHPLFND